MRITRKRLQGGAAIASLALVVTIGLVVPEPTAPHISSTLAMPTSSTVVSSPASTLQTLQVAPSPSVAQQVAEPAIKPVAAKAVARQGWVSKLDGLNQRSAPSAEAPPAGDALAYGTPVTVGVSVAGTDPYHDGHNQWLKAGGAYLWGGGVSDTPPPPPPTPVAQAPVSHSSSVAHQPAAPRGPPVSHAVSGSTLGGGWAALRTCESGGDYAINTGNGYYGAYQFDQRTWTANGGAGRPDQASQAEQDRIALLVYRQRGSSPWPVCGEHLH